MRRLASVLVLPVALAAGCAGASAGSGGASGNASVSTTTSATAPAVTPSTATRSAAPARDAASPGKAVTFSNWPNYHRTATKNGVAAGGVKGPLHHAWTTALDGAVWSEPVIANDVLIAATEHDAVYGLNPNNGKVIWHKKLGTPEPLSEQPCGDIDPIGITSAPAYDPATGSVFVVATTGRGTHTLWALNAKTGAKRWHRSVDVDKARDKNAEQQRAALLVIDKRVIVTYGAHAGDCGNYVGYAASAATNGKGAIPYYAVPNARQAGMWGAVGPVEAIDGNILTPTANGSNRTGGTWDHSDGVIELNPRTMRYVRGWAPTSWLQGDIDDQSLGSTSPVRVGDHYVVGGKRGTVWLLKASLGGVGGAIDAADLSCGAFGGAAAVGTTVILPCKTGTSGILAVTAGTRTLHTKWRANGIYGSPVIAGQKVFVADLDTGSLKVLSLATGHVQATISVGSLPTFPSEVVDANHIFVPTLTGITAIRGS